MPRLHVALAVRLPETNDLRGATELASMVQQLRSQSRPEEWAAVERFALAVLAEASVDRETALQVVHLASSKVQ